MKNIIIGTAGHVDHGKTQLIKALSNIDTDRLSEEKKRGITIELGFAHIPNDQGYNIGVIDVPGHEKFIKNMLAGIGGIDFVLFVVAADEGIMPQTREHFEILRALGIEDGIIVVTKTDMVEKEWLELVTEDIRDYVKGSFLEDKPLIPVSSKTGENIDVLKEEILKKCNREIKRVEAPELFRLPVDRVFSMSGFGTVVTGTLTDGRCRVGDEVYIFPENTKTKIRGIQTYGKDVQEAVAGQRTAVNLAALSKNEVDRGDVLAAPDGVSVTSMIDVEVSIFDSTDRVIKNNSRVHLYCGSKEALCKIILLDREAAVAGDKVYAQLRLEEPVAVRRGDRFIIRFYSPIVTVGGGRVLDSLPDKHKRNREDVLNALKIMAEGDPGEMAELKTGGRRFYSSSELAFELGMLPSALKPYLDEKIQEGRIAVLEGGLLVGGQRLKYLEETAENLLKEYHSANPLSPGMPKQELLSRLGELWHIEKEKTVSSILNMMVQKGIIKFKEKSAALAGFAVELTEEQKADRTRILEAYRKAGIEMLKNDELAQVIGKADGDLVPALQADLASSGEIVKVSPEYFISSEGWEKVKAAALSLESGQGFTLAEFRDSLGTSRKFASVLLQGLDKAGITVFDGERRRVH